MKHNVFSKNSLLLSPTPVNYTAFGQKPGDEYWILGIQFLQDYYTIYDWENK